MGNWKGQTLLDLPHAILIMIAEYLPLADLPNFVSCSRSLASMAMDFYNERRTVDMSCFDPVTPRLCHQLIGRFSEARLQKCVFRFDVGKPSSYDQDTLGCILRRFLDNINPSNAQLLDDLRSGRPRMIDILAHCYFLDKLLSTQPHLRELEVDVEFSLFKVPGARGPRHHWQLFNPFVTMDAVQRWCPLLESYATRTASYQSSHMNLLHLQTRFLESCRRLRFVGFFFVLGSEELDTYARLSRPLALEQALFFLPGWQATSPERRRLNSAKLAILGARMQNLKKAVLTFRRRGSLGDARHLLQSLPSVVSVYVRCEFNSGPPLYDIDEGSEPFFGGAFSMLGASVRSVTLWGVPEDEFETLFCAKRDAPSPLPPGVRELRVQLHWCSPNLDDTRERLVDEFLSRAPQLEVCCIAGVPAVPPSQDYQPGPVFCKAKNWWPRRPAKSSLFILSGSK